MRFAQKGLITDGDTETKGHAAQECKFLEAHLPRSEKVGEDAGQSPARQGAQGEGWACCHAEELYWHGAQELERDHFDPRAGQEVSNVAKYIFCALIGAACGAGGLVIISGEHSVKDYVVAGIAAALPTLGGLKTELEKELGQ
jgi:hypothetical protein